MKVKRTVKMKVARYEVGDVISFKLTTGKKVEAMAMEQVGDDMEFCFVDCLSTEYSMNNTHTNEGGFDESDLRGILNSEIVSKFPAKILARMSKYKNGDLLTIPTEKQIFGKNEYGEDEPSNVKQWEPMKLRKNRIALQGLNGNWKWYFLRNKVKESASNFCIVYSDGSTYGYSANSSVGVRPVFRLKNK